MSALAYAFDSDLKPFFLETMKRHIRGDPGVLYQAMIAMDMFDEEYPSSLGGEGGASLLEEDLNRQKSQRYLRLKGMFDEMCS